MSTASSTASSSAFPFTLISGSTLGVSRSSLEQIGSPIPSKKFGQADLQVAANMATGNLVLATRPVRIMDVGGPIEISCVYNSGDPLKRHWYFGVGGFLKPPTTSSATESSPLTLKETKTAEDSLSHPLDGSSKEEKIASTATTLTFTETDGAVVTYTQDPSKPAYFRAPGFTSGTPYFYFDATEKAWVRYHPGTETLEIYNDKGLIRERRDRAGNATKFTYDPTGRVLKGIVTARGDEYVIEDLESSPFKVGIFEKNKTTKTLLQLQQYDFDTSNRLQRTKTFAKEGGTPYETWFEYKGDSPQLADVFQSDQTHMGFAYESSAGSALKSITTGTKGEKLPSTTTFEYNVPARTTKITDSSGAEIHWTSDTSQRVIDVSQAAGFLPGSTEGCNIHLVSELLSSDRDCYAYQKTGMVQKVFYIDSNGEHKVVPITDMGKFDIEFTKIMQGAKHRHLIPDEIQNLITSNGGFPWESTGYQYAPTGQLACRTDAGGGQTRWEYEHPLGLCTRETQAEGQQTDYRYEEKSDRPKLTIQTSFLVGAATPTIAPVSPTSSSSTSSEASSSSLRSVREVKEKVVEETEAIRIKPSESLKTTPHKEETKELKKEETKDPKVEEKAKETPPTAPTPLVTRSIYDPNFDGKGHSFLKFHISPTGQVTEYFPVPETGKIQKARTFLKNTYDVSKLPPDKTPTLEEMKAWVLTQDKTQVSLFTYTYDSRGQVTETKTYADVDAKGEGIINERMGLETAMWDTFGGCTQHFIKREGKEGLATEQKFDCLHRVIRKTEAVGTPLARTTSTDYRDEKSDIQVTLPNGRVELTHLDARGLSASEKETVTSETRTTEFSRDTFGHPIVTTHPDNRKTLTFYDLQHRPVVIITPTGLTTEITYDRIHRYQTTTRYAKAIDLKSLWPEPRTALPTLKQLGIELQKLKDDKATYPKARTRLVFRNLSGFPLYHVDGNLNVVAILYDSLNRRVGKIAYDAKLTPAELATLKEGKSLARPLDLTKDRYTRTIYDANNKIIATKDPAGYVTEFKRDAGGRVIEEILYDTKTLNPFAATLEGLRPTSSPKDAHTYSYYNGRHCVASVDPEGTYSEYTYNAAGFKTTTKRCANPITDPAWIADKTKQPKPPIPSSEDEVSETIYDTFNRPIDEEHSNGTWVQHRYDVDDHEIVHHTQDARVPTSLDPTDQRGTQQRFDAWNQCLREANFFVAQRLLEIDKDSKLTPEQKKIETEKVWSEQSLRYTFDATGLKLFSTDPLGNKTFYYYDDERRPQLVIDATGTIKENINNEFHEVDVIRGYSNRLPTEQLKTLTGGFLSKFPALQALIIKLQDPKDAITTVDERDHEGNALQTTDPEKAIRTKKYNSFGECVEEKLPVMSKTPTLTITTIRDVRGLEEKTIKTSGTNSLTITRKFENPRGLTTDVVDERGGRQSTEYDRNGKVIEVVDARGISTHYTRDAFGRVKTETPEGQPPITHAYRQAERSETQHYPESGITQRIQTTVFGDKKSETDGNGNTTTYKRAPDGQVVEKTDPLGRMTKDKVDFIGQHKTHITPSGIQTDFEYDGAGHETQRVEDTGGLKLTTTTEIQDGLDHRILTTDPKGIKRLQLRDKAGREQSMIVDPNPSLLALAVSPKDKESKEPKSLGCEGTVARMARSGIRGELSTETQKEKTTATPLHLTTITTATPSGEKATVMRGDAKNPDGFLEAFEYDGFNRVTGHIVDPKTPTRPDTLALATRHTLEPGGKVIKKVDPEGNITHSFYNTAGEKRYQVSPEGAITQWDYDPTTGWISLETRYQAWIDPRTIDDKTTWQELQKRIATLVLTNPRKKTTRTFYDALGRPRFTVTGLGRLKETMWDGASNKIKTTGYADFIPPDEHKDLTTERLQERTARRVPSPKDKNTYWIYDKANQPRFTIAPNKRITEHRYDLDGNEIQTIQYATPVTDPATIAKLPADQVLSHITLNPKKDRYTLKIFDGSNHTRIVYKEEKDENGKTKTVAVEEKAPIFEITPEGKVTKYTYDANGNNTETCVFNQTVPLPMDYDAVVTLVKSWKPDVERGKEYTRVVVLPKDAPLPEKDPLRSNTVYLTQEGINLTAHWFKKGIGAERHVFKQFDRQSLAQSLALLLPEEDTVSTTILSSQKEKEEKQDLALAQVLLEKRLRRLETLTAPVELTFTAHPTSVQQIKSWCNLLPKDRVTKKEFDAANRLTREIDALGYSDSYTLDAVGNRTVHSDRAAQPWNADYDRAGRCKLKTSPEIGYGEVTRNPTTGALSFAGKIGSINTRQTFDRIGNQTSVVEAAGTLAERSVETKYNSFKKPTQTVIRGVPIYDGTLATLAHRPEKTVDLTTRILYDGLQNAIAEQDNSGFWSFHVFDEDSCLRYEIETRDLDPNAATKHFAVVETECDTFGKAIKAISHGKIITLDVSAIIAKGGVINPDDIAKALKSTISTSLSLSSSSDDSHPEGKEEKRDPVARMERSEIRGPELETKTAHGLKTTVSEEKTGKEKAGLPTTPPPYNPLLQPSPSRPATEPPPSRTKTFERDVMGNVTVIETDPILYYQPALIDSGQPATYGWYKPRTEITYDLFDDAIEQKECIGVDPKTSLPLWSRALFWYDRESRHLAELNPNNGYARWTYTPFGQEETRREFAIRLTGSFTAGMPLADVDARMVPAPNDRCIRSAYDVRGDRTLEETRVGSTPPHLVTFDEKTWVPTMTKEVVSFITKRYEYTTRQQRCVLVDANGGRALTWYDARASVIFESEVPRTLLDASGKQYIEIPFNQYLPDALGQPHQYAVMVHYINGTLCTDPNLYPQAKLPDPARDQYTVYLRDKRGLLTDKQDSEGALDFTCYYASTDPGCTYKPVRQMEPGGTTKVHIDETRWQYFGTRKIYCQSIRRDNTEVQATYHAYSTFKECTAESDDPANWKTRHEFAPNGIRWKTNEKNGTPVIELTDLRGKVTVSLTAAKDDLTALPYEQLAAILPIWDAARLERRESVRDLEGRVVEKHWPMPAGSQATAKPKPIVEAKTEAPIARATTKEPVSSATPPPSTAVVVATHRFALDRWGNIISFTDANDNTTLATFDHNDELYTQTNPLVTVVDEKGVSSPFRGTHQFGRNRLKTAIGTIHADKPGRLSTEARLVNEGGQTLAEVLPDGTRPRIYRPNGLGQVVEYCDARQGVPWQRIYNRRNKITEWIQPSGRKTQFVRNELDLAMAIINPMNFWRIYQYNPTRDLTLSIEPGTERTSYDWDRHHTEIKATFPDGTSRSKITDFFGVELQSTDRAGSTRIPVYDYKRQMIGLTSTTAFLHGSQAMVLDLVGSYESFFVPNPGQNLKYTYVAGILTQILDTRDASSAPLMSSQTDFRCDLESRRTGLTFTEIPWIGPPQVIRHLQSQHDPLGRVVRVEDENKVVWGTGYSHRGSRRFTRWTFPIIGTFEGWNDFNENECIVQEDGVLEGSRIVDGLLLTYEQGFRKTETKEEKRQPAWVTKYTRDIDARLEWIETHAGKLLTSTIQYVYDPAERLAIKRTNIPLPPPFPPAVEELVYQHDANDRLLRCDEKGSMHNPVAFYSNFLATGEPQHQEMITYGGDTGGPQPVDIWYTDVLDTNFLLFDVRRIGSIGGTRWNSFTGKQSAWASQEMYYDQNGGYSAHVGPHDDQPHTSDDLPWMISYKTTPEGWVMRGMHMIYPFHPKSFPYPTPSYTYPLYTPTGLFLGSYSTSGFGMKNQRAAVGESLRGPVFSSGPRGGREITLAAPHSSLSSPRRPWPLTPFDPSDAHFSPWDPFKDLDPEVRKIFVKGGDSYGEISQEVMNGDANIAELLQEAWGDLDLAPGMQMTLPQLTTLASHYTASTSPPLEEVAQRMLGSFAMQYKFPPPPPEHRHVTWWKVALVAAVGAAIAVLIPAAISMVGPALLGITSAAIHTLVGTIITSGITGAIGSVTTQFLGMSLGLQDHFSVGSVLIATVGAAFTAGLMFKVGNPMQQMLFIEKLARVGTAAAMDQALEMIRDHRHFDFKALIGAIASSMAQIQLSPIFAGLGKKTSQLFSQATQSAMSSAMTSISVALANGGPVDFQTLSANLIGGTLGASLAMPVAAHLEQEGERISKQKGLEPPQTFDETRAHETAEEKRTKAVRSTDTSVSGGSSSSSSGSSSSPYAGRHDGGLDGRAPEGKPSPTSAHPKPKGTSTADFQERLERTDKLADAKRLAESKLPDPKLDPSDPYFIAQAGYDLSSISAKAQRAAGGTGAGNRSSFWSSSVPPHGSTSLTRARKETGPTSVWQERFKNKLSEEITSLGNWTKGTIHASADYIGDAAKATAARYGALSQELAHTTHTLYRDSADLFMRYGTSEEIASFGHGIKNYLEFAVKSNSTAYMLEGVRYGGPAIGLFAELGVGYHEIKTASLHEQSRVKGEVGAEIVTNVIVGTAALKFFAPRLGPLAILPAAAIGFSSGAVMKAYVGSQYKDNHNGEIWNNQFKM